MRAAYIGGYGACARSVAEHAAIDAFVLLRHTGTSGSRSVTGTPGV